MLERVYQARLIKRLKKRFPGIFILKLDPQYLQGVPDLLLLFNDRWAMLEVKCGPVAHIQPNQAYYVDLLNSMSFAAFIDPTNEEDILNELALAFEFSG